MDEICVGMALESIEAVIVGAIDDSNVGLGEGMLLNVLPCCDSRIVVVVVGVSENMPLDSTDEASVGTKDKSVVGLSDSNQDGSSVSSIVGT